jgi:DNA modification methylase
MLRDYGYEGQWGLEPTFQLYLEHLWSMMDEIYRVLKPDGTCWINLGDTYSGSGGSGGDYNVGGLREGQPKVKPSKIEVKNKCLLLIPHRFAIGCIDRGWIMRNDCIWAKRNGMPESVTDRFSKKHEYFFFMVKSEKYFFDLDAIKDKTDIGSIKRSLRGNDKNKYSQDAHLPKGVHANTMSIERPYQGYNNLSEIIEQDKGKNPGSVSDFWDIPTKPSKEKHYAMYNDSLLVKPVLAGCPEGGIIYDPFMGTGSTAEVALRSSRLFIGSEMGADNCKIANKRLEPFLKQYNIF